MLLPNYSVDIGSFNSPVAAPDGSTEGQNVNLQGTIVAGVLDVRGTATLDGTLVLTFSPEYGVGPLQQYGQPVGNPADFNTTLGYFGFNDGDGESVNPDDLPIVDGSPIVGWDLDGDGIPDLNYDQTPTPEQIAAGAQAIPFNGFGRIQINWDPERPMPDGIMLRLSLVTLSGTYTEGQQ